MLLAIDLTKAVADEAIDRGDSVVVAYRMLSTLLHMLRTKRGHLELTWICSYT